jgi:GT2 family glycosyltransferase
MLLRRAAFETVGGFDESYFAYFEDADLCWRLWLRGYTVRFQPAARVLHAYGGSTTDGRLSPFRIKHCQANRLQNMTKHLEVSTFIGAFPASLAYDSLRLVQLVSAGRLRAARALIAGTAAFFKMFKHAVNERRRCQTGRVRSDRELLQLGALVDIFEAAREWRRLGGLRPA